MVKEKGAFSKTKIKGHPKNSDCGGKTSMHKSTSILDFFKMNSRPPSGGFFAACGILLCYVIYYISIVTDCELVYDGTRVGGSCLI